MSKRQEIRQRRQKERLRNRLLVILLVVAGALIITFVLILPGLKGSSGAATIVQITPAVRNAAIDKTSIGDPNAPVKVDVWEDFQCPGCKSYSEDLEPQIIQAYVETGKVFYTFHMFPFIDDGQGESHQAANAAMCAMAQGRFWDYHDLVFANWIGENQGSYTNTRLVAFAQSLNLDMTAFNQCFKANTYSAQIQQDRDAGAKLGVPPTPAIFVDGKLVVSSDGPTYIPSFDDVSKIIEAALAGQ